MITTAEEFHKRKRLAIIMVALCLAVLFVVLLTTAPSKKALYSNDLYSLETPSDWDIAENRSSHGLTFIKDNTAIGGVTQISSSQVPGDSTDSDNLEAGDRKEIKGLAAKAILESREVISPAVSGETPNKNENHLFLLFSKNGVAYDIFADAKQVDEAKLIEIGRSFKYLRDRKDNQLIGEYPKRIRIDYIGANKTTDVVDAKQIKEIIDFLNGLDVKAMSEEKQASIMASSVGGIRITPDDRKANSVFIHGAGAMSVPQNVQKKMGFKTDLCELTGENVRKAFDVLNWPQQSLQ